MNCDHDVLATRLVCLLQDVLTAATTTPQHHLMLQLSSVGGMAMATSTSSFVRQDVARLGEDGLQRLPLRVANEHAAEEHQHGLEASEGEGEVRKRSDLVYEEGEYAGATQFIGTGLSVLRVLGVAGCLVSNAVRYREVVALLTLLLAETRHAVGVHPNPKPVILCVCTCVHS